ncbi:unnamed protein product [Lathyrus sativus]|nr:unnamed protein product [Lathyrus sativus]
MLVEISGEKPMYYSHLVKLKNHNIFLKSIIDEEKCQLGCGQPTQRWYMTMRLGLQNAYGTKKAYVRLTPDYDALDVARNIVCDGYETILIQQVINHADSGHC